MLQLTISGGEVFDQEKQMFISAQSKTISLEHSLVSLSKWESKWEKPFLTANFGKLPKEQIIDYVRCMTLTQNVDPNLYYLLTNDDFAKIMEYINRKMTATTFSKISMAGTGATRKETTTAELLYYYMFSFGIPMECQKWHLNRLLTLIRVCQIKEQPPKKYSKADQARYNHSLNAARHKRR